MAQNIVDLVGKPVPLSHPGCFFQFDVRNFQFPQIGREAPVQFDKLLVLAYLALNERIEKKNDHYQVCRVQGAPRAVDGNLNTRFVVVEEILKRDHVEPYRKKVVIKENEKEQCRSQAYDSEQKNRRMNKQTGDEQKKKSFITEIEIITDKYAYHQIEEKQQKLEQVPLPQNVDFNIVGYPKQGKQADGIGRDLPGNMRKITGMFQKSPCLVFVADPVNGHGDSYRKKQHDEEIQYIYCLINKIDPPVHDGILHDRALPEEAAFTFITSESYICHTVCDILLFV